MAPGVPCMRLVKDLTRSAPHADGNQGGCPASQPGQLSRRMRSPASARSWYDSGSTAFCLLRVHLHRVVSRQPRSSSSSKGIRLAAWEAFAEITGSAAAALTGLLFVAVSIRIDYIARSQELRNRAAQTLILFGTVLFVAILIALPGQAYRALGAELVLQAGITGVGLYLLDRRARAQSSNQEIGRVLDAVAPNGVTSLLLGAAGIVLVLGVHAGLYVLVAPVLVAFAGGVASAWLLLTKITG